MTFRWLIKNWRRNQFELAKWSSWQLAILSIFYQPVWLFLRYFMEIQNQWFVEIWKSRGGHIVQALNFNFPFFLTKICFFDKRFYFWPKDLFLSKISIFEQKFYFWTKFLFLSKISIFELNFYFWAKFLFFTKISIFQLNFYFSPKFYIFDQIFYLWPKLRFFPQNFDCWSKFLLLAKISIFYQIFILV